jgi:hypothetical protein
MIYSQILLERVLKEWRYVPEYLGGNLVEVREDDGAYV